MAAGNRSFLVVLDSRRVAQRAAADTTVFAALEHFGVAYEVLECGDYMPLPQRHVASRGGYVLAHDGAGAGLKPALAAEIAAAVRAGAGLVSFDREADGWSACLRALLPPVSDEATVESLRFPAAPDFVTFGHPQGETVGLRAPVRAISFAAGEGWRSLLETEGGGCVLVRGSAGAGRVVAFGVGERLYAEEVYGHTRGLDGLMWRALVWAALKPLPMRCIPPYVTARMDDCNGTYGAFGYVEPLARHGIAPNLGLFTDEMGPAEWEAARRLFDRGAADFSMHAFRDDFYKASPRYRGPYLPTGTRPDLSDGGKHTAFEGLSVDHQTGRDLDDETVRRNFRRMDDAFARAGIRHSRVVNAHFGEIGWRAIPLFLERGADLATNNGVPGQLYGNQPPWRPRPYGVRGANGRYGIIVDRYPGHPGLTLVGASVSHAAGTHMGSDILNNCTPFNGEAEEPRPQAAIERGIANLRLYLDSLAFATIMCHEERIDALSPEEWDGIVAGILRGIDGWDIEPAGREQVSVVCKRLLDSRLVHASVTPSGLVCEVSGFTDGPSPLTVWENVGDACVRRVVEVPRMDGFAAVTEPLTGR